MGFLCFRWLCHKVRFFIFEVKIVWFDYGVKRVEFVGSYDYDFIHFYLLFHRLWFRILILFFIFNF
jgi:hypothetical protein